MSSGTPFIGSKISLISRAEIRYEGILYQVDTKESTVTLAKVRSFGTEDRPSAKQIPPRNEVYEFIIFRANDIKDLNVSEMPEEPNSPPQDPAILSAQSAAPVPSSSTAPTGVETSQPPPTHPPQPPVQHNAHSHYYPHPQGMGNYSPFGMGMPYYRPPVMMGAGGPHPPPPGIHQPHPMTATNQGMPPPVVPPHVSVIGAPPAQSHTPPRPIPSTTTHPSGFVATPTYAPPAGVETKPQASSTPVVAVTEPALVSQSISSAVNTHSENINSAPDSSQSLPPSHPRDSVQANTQRREREDFTDRRKQQGQAKWERGGRGRGDNRSGRGYYRENYHNKSRNGDGENSGRGGYTNRQQGARGGHNSQQQQGGRGSGGHSYRQQQTNSAKPAPFKYDSDFDFESANARFKKENLEQEFEKLRLDSGSSRKASVETLGEEEAGSDDEVVIVEEGEVVEEVEECYDKSKSFFDNISCEGTSKKRPSRSQEREVNMETFGVSGVNRGYRNRRGGGRWRGRGGGYRGRYGGGWSNDGGRQGGSRGGGGGGYTGDGGGNRQGYHSERQSYHSNSGNRRGGYHGNRRGDGGYNRDEVEREA